MSWCNPPPFAEDVLREATRISPTRRTSSDGICGDRAHQQEVSDHNPDSRGIPHAVDISQSMPGAPFWEPRFGRFDAHSYARQIAKRRDPRVKYMVIGQPDGPDIIWAQDHDWRQNGDYKTEHRSHLHLSFTVEAEQSTAPFFMGVPEDDVTPQDKKDIIDGVLKVLRRQPDGTPGLIGDEVAHVFGGYPDGKQYEDGALIKKLRKDNNLAQS